MRALAALGFVLAALASAKPQPGRPLLRSVTTPWVQWFDAARARDAAAVADPPPRHRALGKIKSSFQPSSRGDRAVGNLPRCNRRQFLNTTLPIFARECRSLLSDEGSAYGCSLSCARAFAVVSATDNAKCVGMVLDDRDKLRRAADRSMAVDIPPPPYFASLYTEAFTRCGSLPAHARGPHFYASHSTHCRAEAEESFKSRLVPIFMQECRSLPDKEPKSGPPCPEACVHSAAALKAHPCFGRWFEDLVLFRQKFPSDAVAEEREATLFRAGARCSARVDAAAEVRNLCSEQDYVLFEELRLPAMLHACLEPRGGGDYPDPRNEEEATVTTCPLTCAHTLWQVLQDSHCLQRYQRNAASQDRDSGRLVGHALATALDVCGLGGRGLDAAAVQDDAVQGEGQGEVEGFSSAPGEHTTAAGYGVIAIVVCAALIALVVARMRASREAVVVEHA